MQVADVRFKERLQVWGAEPEPMVCCCSSSLLVSRTLFCCSKECTCVRGGRKEAPRAGQVEQLSQKGEVWRMNSVLQFTSHSMFWNLGWLRIKQKAVIFLVFMLLLAILIYSISFTPTTTCTRGGVISILQIRKLSSKSLHCQKA